MSIITVCVHVHVKEDNVNDFIEASRVNGENTVQEPGNLRFDVIQQLDDPTRFVLYEVWRDEAGMNAHKETAHYAVWRDAVAPWMAEPRQGVKHAAMFPTDPALWKSEV